MATAAAALIAKARREIQHAFFEADAVRPDRAIAFQPRNGFEQRQFARYRTEGAIKEVADGRYWLDVVAYDGDLRRRHDRVRFALLLVITALALGGLLGAWSGHIH